STEKTIFEWSKPNVSMNQTSQSMKTVRLDNYLSFSELFQYFEQANSNLCETKFGFQALLKKMDQSIIGPSKDSKKRLANFAKIVNSNNIDHTGAAHFSDYQDIIHFFDLIFSGYNGMAFVSIPFSSKIVVANAAFNEVVTTDHWEINVNLWLENDQLQQLSNFNQLIYILNHFYGQNIYDYNSRKLSFRHKETGIIRHYKIDSNYGFTDIQIKGELPQLSEADINELVNNYSDALFEEKIGSDKVTFSGFELSNLVDITQIEAINELRHQLLKKGEEFTTSYLITSIKNAISSILNISDLDVGASFTGPLLNYHSQNYSLSDLAGRDLVEQYVEHHQLGKAYDRVFKEKTAVSIEDLSSYAKEKCPERLLHDQGYQSAIIIPISSRDGDIALLIETATKNSKHKFGDYTLMQLKEMIDIFEEAFGQAEINYQQKLTEVIQHQFTAIHPSVHWKFEQAAAQYLAHLGDDEAPAIAPIAFNQLHTLYGQSDIVGSSRLRNASIQLDLIKNLELLDDLLQHSISKQALPLLAYYRSKVLDFLADIREHFVSRHESEIVTFITKGVHPYLDELSRQDFQKEAYQKYLEILDADYNIVYEERKKFEDSVTQLNQLLANFIDQADAKMQSFLPHFYEKYKTDGIEYNIYLGQALLEVDRDYTPNDLSNFRIWQLEMMCQLVQLVEKSKSKLPIPLSTAQLIFVYNQPLSILFRMDEKKFDVDGAYNVRYEILKKRIDKATIKGTKDRLTVEGKIAIVYLSEEDKRTYLPYLNYLINQGYIGPDIEHLELNNLQGAEGLRALRITVKT
ncbi:MAG: hypothetical protein AAF985_23950, partial [Bacteroidota bacterium]